MIIVVDPDSGEPPYQQIRRQVIAAVVTGGLVEGARLPTIRQLAGDLDLAVNTVARAYRELEADGVLETRGRGGSFVRLNPEVLDDPSRRLDGIVSAFLEEARGTGAGAGDIAAAVARALVGPHAGADPSLG